MHLLTAVLACAIVLPACQQGDRELSSDVIRILGPNRINLCNQTRKSVEYTCKLPTSHFKSSDSVSITGPGPSQTPRPRMSETDGDFMYKAFLTFETGGYQTVKCEIHNAARTRRIGFHEIIVMVFEPADRPPDVYVNDETRPVGEGDVISVMKSTPVTIKCVATSGYPKPRHFRLQCGDEVKLIDGGLSSVAEAEFQILASQNCSCEAIQEVECSKMLTKFRFETIFGPEVVTAKTDKLYVSLCPPFDNTFVHVICEVPVTSVNPLPAVILTGLEEWRSLKPIEQTVEKGNYRFLFKYKPTRGRHALATCLAANVHNPKQTASSSVMIIVAEPPKESPVITVNNVEVKDQTAYVSDVKYTIFCQIRGGNPIISEVKLDCDDNTFLIQKPVELPTKRTTCHCTGKHISGCYSKSQKVNIRPEAASHISQFIIKTGLSSNVKVRNGTVSESLTSVAVDRGDTTTFVCEGQGLPQPTVWLESKSFNETKNGTSSSGSGGNTNRLEFQFYPESSNDSADVSCATFNNVGSIERVTVQFLVKGPLEFPEYFYPEENFTLTYGENLEIWLKVTGYPQPSSVKLFKVDEATDASGATDQELTELAITDYDIRVVWEDISYGQVMVKLSASSADDALYLCRLSNGIGEPLEYRFSLTVSNWFLIVLFVIAGLTVVIGVVFGFVVLILRWRLFVLHERRMKQRREAARERRERQGQENANGDDGDRADGCGSDDQGREARSGSDGRRALPRRPSLTPQSYDDVAESAYIELDDVIDHTILNEYEQPDGFLPASPNVVEGEKQPQFPTESQLQKPKPSRRVSH